MPHTAARAGAPARAHAPGGWNISGRSRWLPATRSPRRRNRKGPTLRSGPTRPLAPSAPAHCDLRCVGARSFTQRYDACVSMTGGCVSDAKQQERSSMNLQRCDLPLLEHEAEFERHRAARKVAAEFGLEDCLSVPTSDLKRRDGVVVFFLRIRFPLLDGGES